MLLPADRKRRAFGSVGGAFEGESAMVVAVSEEGVRWAVMCREEVDESARG